MTQAKKTLSSNVGAVKSKTNSSASTTGIGGKKVAQPVTARKTAPKASLTSQNVSLELKLKPMDTFYSQLDHRKLARSRLDALALRSPSSFLNSTCLSLHLSDTLLNVFRDINFDSCTLCVCTHHTIKGVDYPIYICQDIFGVADENDINVYNASAGCLTQQQQQHQQNDPMPSNMGPGVSDANVSLQG